MTADTPGGLFVLSPASLTGVRGERIVSGRGHTPLVGTLRRGGSAPLGDVYAAISSLYFGGKRDYARHFARAPGKTRDIFVITPSRGLLPLDAPVDLDLLRAFRRSPIDLAESRYVRPLLDTATALRERLASHGDVVLLGSIATSKYLEPLGEVFSDRLLFPRDFLGRGSLSRGSVLRKAVAANRELEYVSAGTSPG